MKENRENKLALKYLAVLLSLVLTGCGTIGLAQESTFESAYENGKEEEPAAPAYTSASRGVLISINTEDRSFVIHRTAEGGDIVLNYTGDRLYRLILQRFHGTESVSLCICAKTVRYDEILFFEMKTRVHHLLCKFTVVCHYEKPFAVFVQSADGVKPCVYIADKFADVLSAHLIVCSRNISCRFVERDVIFSSAVPHTSAFIFNYVFFGFDLLSDDGDFAVHGETTRFDFLFGSAAAHKPAIRNIFL